MFRSWLVVVSLIFGLTSTALAQQNTRDGAVIGGTAGAVIGGIIGHQNDETPEGAIIGGLVGAVAGGLAGKAKDQQMARERYYQNQLYQQQQQLNQISQPCLAVGDVVSMSRSGLSDQVIINYLNTNGVERQLNVSEIISLHQQGVSENVISAMQRAPIGNQVARQQASAAYQPAPQQPTTVIVREQYQVMPPPTVIYRVPPPAPVIYWQYGGGHRHYHR